MQYKPFPLFPLPQPMVNIISATILETAPGDIMITHDSVYLYAAKIVKQTTRITFQKFSLPGVTSIVPLIKNYFMALFDLKRITLFEVSFSEAGKIIMKYVYNKEKPFCCYFLREVVDNMAEVQIFYPEGEVKIYQLTVNGKVGFMNYAINPQNKIRHCDRQHLYGSKTMLSNNRKMLYYFTSFSKNVLAFINLNKLENQISQFGVTPLSYVCLAKTQDFYLVTSNYTVINVSNPTVRHKVSFEPNQADSLQKSGELKVSSYFQMIMVEDTDKEVTNIFQIKQNGSALVGQVSGKMNWFWACGKKLVGLSVDRSTFKIIQNIKFKQIQAQNQSSEERSKSDYKYKGENISDNYQPLKSHLNFKTIIENTSPKKTEQSGKVTQQQVQVQGQQQQQKRQNQLLNKEQNTFQVPLPSMEKYRPAKIIQKNKTSVSKTLQKSKQIQPFAASPLEEKIQKPTQQKWFEQNNQTEILEVNQQKGQKEQQKQSNEETEESAYFKASCESENVKENMEQLNELNQKQEDIQKQKELEDIIQHNLEAILDESPVKMPSQVSQLGEQQPNSHIQKEGQSKQKQIRQQQPKLSIDNCKQQSLLIPNQQQPKVSTQSKQESKPSLQQKADILPKSLALVIGKTSLGPQYSNPLNLFNTSINRNNIFNSIQIGVQPENLLKRYHSEQEYYNPLAPHSHCISPKKQVETLQVVPSKSAQSEEISRQNANLTEKLKQHFKETTARLVKVLQQMANTNSTEPYLKEKIISQVKTRVQHNLQSTLAGQFAIRIEKYISQVLKQTSEVQEESVKFFKEANNHRSKNLEVQLNNQEKILKEIKEVQQNLRFCMTSLKQDSRQAFQNMLRDWELPMRDMRQVVESLEIAKRRQQQEENAKAKRYEETKKSLESIKALLVDKANFQQIKLQKRQQKQSQKLKQEEKLRNKKKKERSKRLEKQKKIKTKKQTQF